MPKALCVTGMVVAVLVLLLTLLDLLGYFLVPALAPFSGVNRFMDCMSIVAALMLGGISWLTYKEQR